MKANYLWDLAFSPEQLSHKLSKGPYTKCQGLEKWKEKRKPSSLIATFHCKQCLPQPVFPVYRLISPKTFSNRGSRARLKVVKNRQCQKKREKSFWVSLKPAKTRTLMGFFERFNTRGLIQGWQGLQVFGAAIAILEKKAISWEKQISCGKHNENVNTSAHVKTVVQRRLLNSLSLWLLWVREQIFFGPICKEIQWNPVKREPDKRGSRIGKGTNPRERIFGVLIYNR